MSQMWKVRVDDGDGKELYGEDYADIYAMSRLHFKAATNGTCDHVRTNHVTVRVCGIIDIYGRRIVNFRTAVSFWGQSSQISSSLSSNRDGSSKRVDTWLDQILLTKYQ